MSEVPLERPRFAVVQGFASISDRDRVVRVDPLQMRTDELEAAARKVEAEAVQEAREEAEP